MRWRATRRPRCRCSGWPRGPTSALDGFEHHLAYHSDIAAGARQLAQAMRADLFDIACDFYLAGPEAFVHVLHDELRAAGVAAGQIRTEVL